MNGIGMKFLNFAAFLVTFGFSTLAEAEHYVATMASLPVGWGEVYFDVKVVSAAEYGLTFRHQNGAAKVLYEWLPREVEEKFRPVAPAGGTDKPAGFKVEEESSGIPPLFVTVQPRVNLPRSGWNAGPVINPWAGVWVPSWRPYWSRYHPAHALVNPYFRNWAVQDFLYPSRLVPRPIWLTGGNLEYRRPRLYFY